MRVTIPSIAILLHDFNAGGTEATAFRLAEEWVARGCRVTFVVGADAGAMRNRLPSGAVLRLLDPPIRRGMMSRWRLARAMVPILRQVRPDIVYITGNFHLWLAPAIDRALPHLRIVAKISNPLLPPLPRVLRPLGARMLQRLTDRVDLLVAMAPELARRDRAMLPGRPIHVAPEPNLPRGHHPLPRQRDNGPPQVIAIGRLEPQKDMALAVRAFARLRARRPARLTILGDGPERAKLAALARRLGVADDVDLPGFVDDVPRRLAGAACLLMTSRFEGFPAVPVEALAADVPVVSTDSTPVLRGLIASPSHGEVVCSRDPAAIAAALERAIALPFRSDGARAASAAPYAAPQAAERYLELFAMTGDEKPCVA